MPLKKQPEEAQLAPSVLADLSSLRVLTVDDNETNRRILHEQVTSWGMVGSDAEDGRRALEMLRTTERRGEPYDLAILDVQMPQMDGVELARRIKADPSISSTRLVLLTSLGQRGEVEGAGRVDVDAYITKPVRQSQLYDTLAKVMGAPVEEGATGPQSQAPLIDNLRGAEAHSYIRLSRVRLLIAEDNVVNQKVASSMLESLGYEADGREVLESLSRVPYAAVLMDVQMPGMDGYEATRGIRRREKSEGRHIPIIAMTANAMQGDRENALEAGMDDYVSKPVKADELEVVLKRWVPKPDAASVTEEETEDTKASTETTASLDWSVLEGLRRLQEEGEPDILNELIGLFLEEVLPQLAALRGAVEDGDAHSVERAAHTLKGNCGAMGAPHMAALGEELEETGFTGVLSRAPDLLRRLEAEFERVRAALSGMLS